MKSMSRLLSLSLSALCAGCGSGGGGGGASGPTLSALAVSAGTLTPAFAPAVTAYSVGPAPLPAEITITATAASAGDSITVNGTATASGVPSSPISLAMGLTGIFVIVTASGGGAQRTYTVSFDRTSAELLSLEASAGSLAPSFLPGVTDYVVGPPILVDTSTLTATAADPTATITIDGEVATSGTPSTPFGVTADVTTIDIVVSARDGSSKTYTVVFERVGEVFFDDFSSPTLGASWSGTATLDAATGVPSPSLALLAGQSLAYVGTPIPSSSGLTLTVDVQRDQFTTAKIRLSDPANPSARWLSFELIGNTFQCQYGNAGALVTDIQGPIPADDHLFHRIVITTAAGTTNFFLDGMQYGQQLAFPTTPLTFTLSHSDRGGGPSSFSRFDDVTLTSP
jgi:hypothetical protein